jgi:HlyD family secretion protein
VAAAGALLLAAATWYIWQTGDADGEDQRYKTARTDRGDIVQKVSANGTLNPVVLVNVGTQVSGTISALYVDYNDHVSKGQILARLEPSLLTSQLNQSEANLASAEADVRLAESNGERTQKMFDKQMVSRAAIDQSQQALAAARAKLETARAQVKRDQTNLAYTVIRSPVAGVVVARDVDLGQTVAASFQTPTLFKIAQDLKRMQIDTSVAEADIGGIKVGQDTSFTVDAFPGREFSGKVRQVRLNPTIVQNVVTYNVVIAVENPAGELMPGMTAYAHIIVSQKNDVLRIPNAALRFRPVAAAPEGDGAPRNQTRSAGGSSHKVYRLQDSAPQAVEVVTGVTDGRYTEMVSGKLQAGDRLVTADREAKSEERKGSFRFRVF